MKLSPGIYRATHKPTGDKFILSVVKCRLGLVSGVAAYPVGRKRPSRKVHALPVGPVADWLRELDLVEINPAAVALGKLGGKASAAKMTDEQRQERARKAGRAGGWPLGKPRKNKAK